LGAESPERGLPALARNEVEEERADGRTGYRGGDVSRRHRVIVVRERHHHHVRPPRQRDERGVQERNGKYAERAESDQRGL